MRIDNNDFISLITNKLPEFAQLFTLANRIFDLRAGLPDQVFKPPFSKFFFENVDWALDFRFFDLCLKPLAQASGDDTLILGIFSDDLTLENVPFFVKFPITMSGRSYDEIIEAGNEWIERIHFYMSYSYSFTWFSASGLWGVWGSNMTGEDAILAFANDDMYHKTKDISDNWMSIYEALNGYMLLRFRCNSVPDKLRQSLIHNYGWFDLKKVDKNIPSIHHYNEFQLIWEQVNNIFFVEKRYPDQVFKEQYKYFLYDSPCWMIAQRAWSFVLKPLALLSLDDAINVVTIDPDPITELYPQQQNFNAAIMPLNTTLDVDYWRTMSAATEIEPCQYIGGIDKNANILAWTVKSGKWAIWSGKRAIIGFSDEDMFNKAKKILSTWLPL